MYILENTETGMKIATFESLDDAEIAMYEFEAEDKKEGNYDEGFYSIRYYKTEQEEYFDAKLYDLIQAHKNERSEDEPLDGDEVDTLVEKIRLKINLIEGNITQKEYDDLIISI